MLFASPTGVRVHGGGSRINSSKQGFRLYLRREYGASTVPPGLLFGPPHEHPLKVLMVHNDVRNREGTRWALTNPFAFDIADAVGAITSPSRPVRLLLNGEYQGVYVLYEHFHPNHYFRAHGQRAVTLDAKEFAALYEQIRALRPLTMAAAGELVDLDNLTRWFLATAFCATRDAFQGPSQFRDGSRQRAQWFWVNWDMDGSFGNADENPFDTLLIPPGGGRRGRRPDEVRPDLLTRLLADDPAYRQYFERMWVDAMNYRLTPAFLRERFEHYRDVAITYGVQPLDYLEKLETFLRGSPRAVARHGAAVPPPPDGVDPDREPQAGDRGRTRCERAVRRVRLSRDDAVAGRAVRLAGPLRILARQRPAAAAQTDRPDADRRPGPRAAGHLALTPPRLRTGSR